MHFCINVFAFVAIIKLINDEEHLTSQGNLSLRLPCD